MLPTEENKSLKHENDVLKLVTSINLNAVRNIFLIST